MKAFGFKLMWKLMVLSLLLAGCASVTPTAQPSPTPIPMEPTAAPELDAKIVTLATLEWPPYVGENLPGYGFATAILSEAFQRAGYQVKIDFLPWARVLQEVESGRYDAGYPAYYSDERAQTYWISDPFVVGPVVFCKRKVDAIAYTTLKDLQPYRIGIVQGYVNTPEFDAADYLQKDAVTSDEQNIRKLLLGRIDLAVIDKFVAQSFMNTTIPEAAEALDFIEPPLDEKSLHLIFSRQTADGDEKVQAFNAALKAMIEDGTLQRILEEYGFGK